MSTGYSGTPLARKLGLSARMRVFVHAAPVDYLRWLDPLPDGLDLVPVPDRATQFVHLFVTEATALDDQLRRLRQALRPDCPVWVSWPKRSSKVATDLTEDVVREIALPLGFVDIKVCAVDAVWSGLKLVVRKALR